VVRTLAVDTEFMTFQAPFATLTVAVGLAIAAGVVAAIRPAQRAAKLDVLRAIAER
jgi:putative ABC transport system permease protein